MSVPVQVRFEFELAPSVPEKAKQGVEACDFSKWEWVEASVWTDRMLAALVNGVKG